VGSAPAEPKVVSFDPALTARLGGVEIAADEQRSILERLEFAVSEDWQVTCPPRRHDIEGAADLVEEVVRIHGLDKVESVALPRAEGVARPTATPEQALERRLRRAAAARGLHEAVTWSFLRTADAAYFAESADGLWVLDNPISEDMKAMRPSLLPGLLAAAKRNLDRGASGLRLFEIGRRYLRGKDVTRAEPLTLAVVLAGEKVPRGWATGKAAMFDAFDAKGEALALLTEAGAPIEKLMVMGEAGPQFHPGQSATLRLGPKNVLARLGALHPATLEAFDIAGPVVAAEIYLDALPGRRSSGFARPPYAPPALQPVLRDFAFLVPLALPAGDLLRTVQGADKANITDARIFDDFRGAGVPDGQKSLAVEVTLQPGASSYAEADLKAISDRIVAAAAKLGATLRG
jgi:phenylalanyl-tRNA synthetase beta chain